MATNFTTLRNSRKTLLTKLADEIKKTNSPQKGADERFWKLPVDAKTGIGYAKMRFLPAPKNEDIPWAKLWSHGFQGPAGSWFIENCPTTLDGRPCPVCKDNNRLWNSGVERDKEVARARKRKLTYISNILIIDDPAHPENNGKTFLYKYGKKIHDKIMELLEPQFPDQKPANPFDLWEGCDFKLKAQKVAGYQNYDKSEFAEPSEFHAGDDAEKEKTWEGEFSLSEFIKEDQFRDFEELSKRFQRSLSGDTDDKLTAGEVIEREARLPIPAAAASAKTADARVTKTAAAPKPKVVEEDADEDDVKKFFASVIDDD
jgi:hypothetical protein